MTIRISATVLFAGALAASTLRAAEYADIVGSTPGLLAWYRFQSDDPSEAGVRDASGGERHARLAGEVERPAESAHPPLGTAVRLGSGGHLRIPELGRHEAISVECWIRLTAPTPEGIAALYAADGWQPGFLHLNLRSSGAVEFAVHGAGLFPNSAPQTIVPGRWTHLVATYDSRAGEAGRPGGAGEAGRPGRVRLYRDGRLVHDASVSPAPAVQLAEAAVGAWFTGGLTRPLPAEIDEFAVYSKALTPEQVRTHFLAGKGVELQPVDFAREVRPLLAERCHGCHGPETRESYLRLDVRDGAYRGGDSGRPAVAAYDAEGSELLRRITSSDRDERMPPDGPPLTGAEIALLRNWIDQGAPWPDELAGRIEPEQVASEHWSFQPFAKMKPPASDDPFVATGNEIDAFIVAGLREKGLAPSPAADARTRIRRLSLDLHGLPPTPDEIEQFVADDSPAAWERLVDRALDSPRYGERWASHWLDVIRYGDTHGFEVNTPRDNAWPYRDYVIRSLNEDKPYDRFIVEQIAGDQFGVDAATGFLVAAPALLPGQVGQDVASMREARTDELHEVLVSVSAGVLGLTVGCARCHDHKFDPVSQRDYYRLQAVFAGLQYGDRPLRNPDEVRLSDAPAMTAAAVFGGTFSQPGPTHRLYRGDPLQPREQVAPDVPAVLGSLSLESTTPEADRRRALAEWLVSPANPLTPRVIVNRVWQHHFGSGLVATPSDFGAMGARPTHPELLDWLAATFVERGWSLKELHRLILRSNTYQQSSRPTEEGLALDAAARLLWRFPPRRLEMEPIRDSVLFVSGVLDLTMGGPGFSVFQANDNYVRVYDPKEEWGPAEWRRMIYVHRVRMEQDGVFGAFDCPDAGQPAPRRGRSTTAIQALNLLNSTFMTQQAELFAERVRREAGDDLDAQITRAFLLALGREPRDSERSASRDVARQFRFAAVCRALYNSNEFLFVP